MRSRRVGVFTLGATLIFFGFLFLIKTIFNITTYTFIIKLWPIILILLGIEILISYLINKEDKYKIDIGSIIILCGMALFSAAMAVMEVFVLHYDEIFYRI